MSYIRALFASTNSSWTQVIVIQQLYGPWWTHSTLCANGTIYVRSPLICPIFTLHQCRITVKEASIIHGWSVLVRFSAQDWGLHYLYMRLDERDYFISMVEVPFESFWWNEVIWILSLWPTVPVTSMRDEVLLWWHGWDTMHAIAVILIVRILLWNTVKI